MKKEQLIISPQRNMLVARTMMMTKKYKCRVSVSPTQSPPLAQSSPRPSPPPPPPTTTTTYPSTNTKKKNRYNHYPIVNKKNSVDDPHPYTRKAAAAVSVEELSTHSTTCSSESTTTTTLVQPCIYDDDHDDDDQADHDDDITFSNNEDSNNVVVANTPCCCVLQSCMKQGTAVEGTGKQTNYTKSQKRIRFKDNLSIEQIIWIEPYNDDDSTTNTDTDTDTDLDDHNDDNDNKNDVWYILKNKNTTVPAMKTTKADKRDLYIAMEKEMVHTSVNAKVYIEAYYKAMEQVYPTRCTTIICDIGRRNSSTGSSTSTSTTTNVMNNSTSTSTNPGRNKKQRPELLSSRLYNEIVQGRKNGYAGLEQCDCTIRHFRRTNIEQTIRMILLEYYKYSTLYTMDELSNKVRKCSQSLSQADRYWAIAIGNADFDAVHKT